jgi:membrane-associated phospholipid phosphatase
MVWRRLQEKHPGVWAFLGRRLSREVYLGLHLTVGLLLSLAAAALFAVIARGVVAEKGLTELDLKLKDDLHAHALASPATRTVFELITEMGSFRTLSVLAVGVALVLLVRRQLLLALVWLIALAGGGLIDAWLKSLFLRERPSFEVSLVYEPTLSFPSGHSMASIVSYGMLAYLLVLIVPHRWLRIAVAGILSLLVLGIGFSRIYLGAHWFSDVLGGFTAGAVWLAFCISGIEIIRRRRLQPREVPAEKSSAPSLA